MLFRCNRGKRIIVDDSLTRKDVKDGMLLPDANKYKKKNKCFKCGRIKLQMTSIAGRMYCCECSSELIEKVSFFREAREMAEGLSKEQLIGYYMAELETSCEVEEELKRCQKDCNMIAMSNSGLAKMVSEKTHKIEILEKQSLVKDNDINKWIEICDGKNKFIDEQIEEISQLKQQLVGKEKELEIVKNMKADGMALKVIQKCNQDKISFAVEQLEKVKEELEILPCVPKYNKTHELVDKIDIRKYIDNQIKELKGKDNG